MLCASMFCGELVGAEGAVWPDGYPRHRDCVEDDDDAALERAREDRTFS